LLFLDHEILARAVGPFALVAPLAYHDHHTAVGHYNVLLAELRIGPSLVSTDHLITGGKYLDNLRGPNRCVRRRDNRQRHGQQTDMAPVQNSLTNVMMSFVHFPPSQ